MRASSGVVLPEPPPEVLALNAEHLTKLAADTHLGLRARGRSVGSPLVVAPMATAPTPCPRVVSIDLDPLREPIARMIADLRCLLGASPAGGRKALGALFDKEKLRRPDPERGFAIQGVATLDLNSLTAPGRDGATGCRDWVVAGTRFNRWPALAQVLRLPLVA